MASFSSLDLFKNLEKLLIKRKKLVGSSLPDWKKENIFLIFFFCEKQGPHQNITNKTLNPSVLLF
jgi:hypothetical protein